MKTILSVTVITTAMLIVISIIGLVATMPTADAGYDYDTPLGPDAIDALMTIPAETAKKFGRTEKVRLCYNIAELLKAFGAQGIRIDALEKQVKEQSIKTLELEKKILFLDGRKEERYGGKPDLGEIHKSLDKVQEELHEARKSIDPNEPNSLAARFEVLDIDFATKVIQDEYNSQNLDTVWHGNPVLFIPYVTDKNNIYLADYTIGFRSDGVVV